VAQTRARDEELARAAANAKPAGEADPYRKPVDRSEAEDTDGDDTVDAEVDADVDAR
jgi:ribosome-binding factor A